MSALGWAIVGLGAWALIVVFVVSMCSAAKGLRRS